MSRLHLLQSRRFWLLAALSGGGLALFVTQLDFAAMRASFAKADLALVALAGAFYLVAHVVRSVRWRVLMSHIHDCGRWRPFHALSIAMLTNNVLPVKAGVAARVHLISSKTPISHAAVGSSLIVESLFDGLIMLGLIVLALALVPMDPTVQAAATGLAVTMLSGAAIVALLLSGRGPTARCGRLADRIPGRAGRLLRDLGSALLEGLSAVRRPTLACATLYTSLMYWLLLGTAYMLLGSAFHLPLGVLEYIALLAVVQLAIGAPSAGAGLGTFQIVMAQTIATMGVGSGAAGAYIVALHAMIVVPVSLLGIALLWAGRAETGRPAAARAVSRMRVPLAIARARTTLPARLRAPLSARLGVVPSRIDATPVVTPVPLAAVPTDTDTTRAA